MPDLAGIRRLSLADLDQPTLEDLVHHGEDLLVERKRDLPEPPKFGAAVASFANTLGGWLLLGVADDGTVQGWTKPGKVDLQSHLGSVLRAQVDPLPPFVSQMREVESKQIAVLRIFPSMDAPHIVRGTGAVYVRSSKGKEPVDDHRTLLDLARRGEDAERRARDRLRELPVASRVMTTPDSAFAEPVGDAEQLGVRYVVRAAPLTVTPALSEWPLARKAAEVCTEVVDALVPPPFSGGPGGAAIGRTGPWIEPYGRAVVARLTQSAMGGSVDSAAMVADSGGVIAIELRRGYDPPVVMIDNLLDADLRPLVKALASSLHRAEAFGRTLADLWIMIGADGQIGGRQRNVSPQLHVSGELTIPASGSEIEALALTWHREIQREIGIVRYEREPSTDGRDSSA